MRIALGSAVSVELDAAREAWNVFSPSIMGELDEDVEFFSYPVSASSPETPRGSVALMERARDRVEHLILQLKREKAEADFYIAFELGFNVVDWKAARRIVLLESWVYVSDGHKGSFGHGGGISVPARLADPVIDRGIELGIVLDRFSKEAGLESEQGPWGLLTHDILSTRHCFVLALISAFAPFYNSDAYR